MARSTSLTILFGVCLLPVGWALPTPIALGDAGTGSDAGGSPGAAMPLGYGAYQGNLTPGDVDWFSFPSGPALGCMEASFLTAHPMRVGYGAGTTTLTGGLVEGMFGTTLAVGSLPPLLGALPDVAPWDTLSVGPYRFEVSVAPPALAGDTKQRDAPASTTGAPAVPGACFSGHFRADGSDVDVYTFTAQGGDVATYSIARSGGAGATAILLDATGQQVGAAVAPGEIGTFAIPQTGTYYAVAASAPSDDSSTYALALVWGPEPSGCRPYCLGMQ